MKRFMPLIVAAVIGTSIFTIGCSEEVSHSQKDTPTLTGGQKHEDTTTYRNADGTYTTTHNESKVNQ